MLRQIDQFDRQAEAEGKAEKKMFQYRTRRSKVHNPIRLWNTWTKENNARKGKGV